jgi:hypothetical protein
MALAKIKLTVKLLPQIYVNKQTIMPITSSHSHGKRIGKSAPEPQPKSEALTSRGIGTELVEFDVGTINKTHVALRVARQQPQDFLPQPQGAPASPLGVD